MTHPLPIIYHPDYMAPLRPNHSFPMSKYGALFETLRETGLASSGFIAPGEANLNMLTTAHDLAYVERVLNNTLRQEEVRRIGLPSTPRVTRRSRLSASGTHLAALLALEHGVGLSCAGGSHHADRDGGSGYCVFNDVAIAAAALLRTGMTRHILIIDLDVHQGDGTAKIFLNDDRVMTVSLHAAKNFPTDKANSDLDVALKDKCTDAGYLETLDQTLDHLTRICEPDLVFYNAGVDVHHEDRLGRLSLTANGIRARDRRVLEWCRSRQLPVTCVMGGGYQSDTRALAGLHAIVFEEAADLFGYTKAAGG